MPFAIVSDLMLAMFPAIALAAPSSLLEPVSPGAQSIISLHRMILWLAAVIFLVVNGLLVYSLVRLRRKSAGEAESNQALSSNVMLEFIWMLIPVAILIALLVLTFQTMGS